MRSILPNAIIVSMKTKVCFGGSREPREFSFKLGAGVWEMLEKTLASLTEEDLKSVTVIHVFKGGSQQPTVIVGPFDLGTHK
jgi:hypothetical protein